MIRQFVAAALVLALMFSTWGFAHTAGADVVGPQGFTKTRTGSVHDFDYFVGGWTTVQHRLKRDQGAVDWETFPAALCMTPYLDGMATVDEMFMPTRGLRGTSGLTLRTFNPKTSQWSIYWVSSATGQLDPTPLVGGFVGDRGEFYAEDQEDGRPTKVRYLWTKMDAKHAKWEQAISYDNETWETNWTADFTRANTEATCNQGHPRR